MRVWASLTTLAGTEVVAAACLRINEHKDEQKAWESEEQIR